MRALKASILAAILSVPLVSAVGPQTPGSLDPVRTGAVSFIHDARRVVACSAKVEQNKTTCIATRQIADASTSLTLRPVASGDVTAKDTREAVQFKLPKESGYVQKLDLAVGTWELDWPGHSDKDRFFVADRDEFAVKLSTEIGACVKNKTECRLKTDRTRLEVKIPNRSRR